MMTVTATAAATKHLSREEMKKKKKKLINILKRAGVCIWENERQQRLLRSILFNYIILYSKKSLCILVINNFV